MKKFVLLLVLIVAGFSVLQAATLDETLEDLSGDAASSYVNPIVSAFGSNLNGGWFHAAPKSKIFGLNVEFGMVFMASMFPDDDKYFDATGSFRFTEDQAEELTQDWSSIPQLQDALINAIITQDFEVGISGPTIIGPEDESIDVVFPTQDITVSYEVLGQTITETVTIQQQAITTGVGGLMEDFSMLPLGAPQLSIGTIYGTKAAFRYVPPMDVVGVGEFNYFGFGIQHNPKAWLKVPLPIDICAAYFTQTMALGDYVTANATAFGLNASKTLGFSFLSITPYAGYMYEMSNMEFTYSYPLGEVNGVELEPLDIKFDIDGKNTSRITLGTTLRLGVFNINADYNIAKYNSITAGFAVGF